MADTIVVEKKCIKCGASDRRENGQCRPCHIASSTAWKVKNKARLLESGDPQFYTYVHRRADDGMVFYVGKGTGVRAHSENSRNVHWHRTKSKHGIVIEVVARWATEAEAFVHEKKLIQDFRVAGNPLCNYTDGGDGPTGYKFTPEQRAKVSAAGVGRKPSAERLSQMRALALTRKGIPRSAEVREKMSLAQKGKKHTEEQIRKNREGHIGLKHSAEQNAKYSASRMGHVVTEETRAKISAAHTGMKYPAEFGAKVSAANKGRIRSPEFKAKIVAALTGRPCSAETREKIAAAQRGKIISQEMRDRISTTLKNRHLATLQSKVKP